VTGPLVSLVIPQAPPGFELARAGFRIGIGPAPHAAARLLLLFRGQAGPEVRALEVALLLFRSRALPAFPDGFEQGGAIRFRE
jgi:hypothetical protein